MAAFIVTAVQITTRQIHATVHAADEDAARAQFLESVHSVTPADWDVETIPNSRQDQVQVQEVREAGPDA